MRVDLRQPRGLGRWNRLTLASADALLPRLAEGEQGQSGGSTVLLFNRIVFFLLFRRDLSNCLLWNAMCVNGQRLVSPSGEPLNVSPACLLPPWCLGRRL